MNEKEVSFVSRPAFICSIFSLAVSMSKILLKIQNVYHESFFGFTFFLLKLARIRGGMKNRQIVYLDVYRKTYNVRKAYNARKKHVINENRTVQSTLFDSVIFCHEKLLKGNPTGHPGPMMNIFECFSNKYCLDLAYNKL